MQTVTRSDRKAQDSSPQSCACPTCRAVRQAQETLRTISFDPNDARGVFCAELAVVFARLSGGLPALRNSIEALSDLAQKAAA